MIGVIAVESARLEWRLAGLLSMLEPNTSQAAALRVPNDLKIQRIKAGFEARPSWMAGATEGVIAWATEAEELLDRRGTLMHSTWIVGKDGIPMSWHLRSGAKTPIDPVLLSELAQRVREQSGMSSVFAWFFTADLFNEGEQGDPAET